MKSPELQQLKEIIQKRKSEILELNDCVAATLSSVNRSNGNKTNGPYDVLIYSENGKKKCKYIKPQYKPFWETKIQNYKRLKELFANWMMLEMKYTQLEFDFQISTKENTMTTSTETINKTRKKQLRQDANYIHIMKYMGSKRELLPDIKEFAKKLLPKGGTILDIFAGTCSVGAYLKNDFTVYSNDIQAYSKVLAGALICSSNHKEPLIFGKMISSLEKYYEKNLKTLEDLFPITLKTSNDFIKIKKDSWTNQQRKEYISFCESFPGPLNNFTSNSKELKQLKEEYFKRASKNDLFPYIQTTFLFSETYFSFHQAMQLDSLRYAIEQTFKTETEKNIALAALMYAHSYCSSGTGHFAMFRDLKTISSAQDVFIYRGKDVFEFFSNKLRELVEFCDFNKKTKHQAISSNYIDLIKSQTMDTVDLVYADPPYSFVHYSRFYHATESLIRYDYNIPEHKGRYRTDRHQSPFCQKQNVEEAFKILIEACARSSCHILLSYADTGMINMERILELLKQNKFSVSIKEINYDHSTMGRSGHKTNKIKEYLIAGKVRDN